MKKLTRNLPIEQVQAALTASTIFDKIEFSGITKASIRTKIKDLRERQVPQRTVLLQMDDEDVVFYWFQNWLHPSLKHAVEQSPRNKQGCTQQVLERDAQRDMLHFYENGQQNFTYSLAEIEAYVKG